MAQTPAPIQELRGGLDIPIPAPCSHKFPGHVLSSSRQPKAETMKEIFF